MLYPYVEQFYIDETISSKEWFSRNLTKTVTGSVLIISMARKCDNLFIAQYFKELGNSVALLLNSSERKNKLTQTKESKVYLKFNYPTI